MASSPILRAFVAPALVWLALAPQGAARQPISWVRELARVTPGTHVAVQGTVTRYRTGRSIAIQDASGSVFVYTEGTTAVEPGDLIEVSGVADMDEAQSPSIANATYQKVGTTAVPQPVPVEAAELARGHNDAALVSVEAAVERVEVGRYEYGIVARAGDVRFTSWVLRETAAGVPGLAPGSRVRITGAVSFKAATGGPRDFEILMRSGADAVVIQPASWWTPRRVRAAMLTLGGVSALLVLYVMLLRRQVERQTAIVRDKLRVEADLMEQYRQAQKMEAVGRLAGGIAHDFNNIMTVVLGHSEILGVELKDNPDLRGSVVEIQRAAERAASLTRQLLAFSRRQKLEPSPVNLNDVAADMVSLFGRVLGGEIEVRAEPAPQPVMVATDRAQLEQALLNLAVNARDAMPDGGRLVVSVSRRDLPHERPAGVLTVKDTGSGIPPEARPHIFDPFFTTKEVGRGSGLGLAMVYGFVQQTGGTIDFESTIGAGTTFELTLPLASAGAPSEAPPG